MDTVVYRAPIFNPRSPDQVDVWADGALRVCNGHIEAVGNFETVMRLGDAPVEVLDGVIIPGFADVHIHWVQYRVRNEVKQSLMPWLRTSVWPEEARFKDIDFATVSARQFFMETTRAGTVMGMSYSSSHEVAVRVANKERIGDWMVGDVIMEHDAPETLTHASIHSVQELDRRASEIGKDRYIVTPRFALSCSADLMAELGAYAQEGGFFVQTHLSESLSEIRQVLEEFPEAEDYTDVYDRAGLLGTRTILGHCVHLSPREWAVLQARGSHIAHCPSSNEALDSGRMDLEAVRRYDIPYALASDVGAGPSHSMLHVMQRFLDVHRHAGVDVSASEALYRATLAGAVCMGKGSITGNLQTGKRADFILMPRPAGVISVKHWVEEWLHGSMSELENRPCATWIEGRRYNPSVSDYGIA